MTERSSDFLVSPKFEFGYEWVDDNVDRSINRILIQSYRERRPHIPRVAVDIGCRTGKRALALATLTKDGQPVFDQILAYDVMDYSRHFNHKNKHRFATPIHFTQANVLDLKPADFEGMDVIFANFRRVGHFLSPPHFRQSIELIKDIVADEGLVCISFEDCRKTFLSENLFPFYSEEGNFYKIERMFPTMQSYNGEDVQAFVSSLGFSILGDEITKNGAYKEETSIVAVAPTRAANNVQKSVAQPMVNAV